MVTPIKGWVYGDSLAGNTGGQTPIATSLGSLRPQDTWSFVSIPNLSLDQVNNPADSSGFAQQMIPRYTAGARNMVMFVCLIVQCNDTTDTAQQIYDKYRTAIQNAQAADFETMAIGVTATTEYNDPLASPYRRPQRIGTNTLLQLGDGATRPAHANSNYYMNIEDVPGLGQLDVPDSGPADPLLFLNDTPMWGAIHLTSFANSLIAQAADVALKTTFNISPFMFGSPTLIF